MDSLDKFQMLGRFIEPWKYGAYPMDKVLIPGSFWVLVSIHTVNIRLNWMLWGVHYLVTVYKVHTGMVILNFKKGGKIAGLLNLCVKVNSNLNSRKKNLG